MKNILTFEQFLNEQEITLNFGNSSYPNYVEIEEKELDEIKREESHIKELGSQFGEVRAKLDNEKDYNRQASRVPQGDSYRYQQKKEYKETVSLLTKEMNSIKKSFQKIQDKHTRPGQIICGWYFAVEEHKIYSNIIKDPMQKKAALEYVKSTLGRIEKNLIPIKK